MSSTLSGLSLAVAVAAGGVAGYTLLRDAPAPESDVQARLDALEERLAELETSAAAVDPAAEAASPTLRGRAELPASPIGVPLPSTTRPGERPPIGTSPPSEDGPDEETVEEIRELVDEAVEKKAAEIRTMQDKEPSIDTFSETLELTEEQRLDAERAIVRSQEEIKSILEIPTDDGTIFVDELVEVMADGIANPGENPGRGMKLFGRLLSENVPGTDETYAARADAVKARLREHFRRSWTEAQYARFESWQMDPTEVKDIEGSPWKRIEARVIERARQLGADIPEDADR